MQESKPRSSPYPISIAVDTNGNFTYGPSTLNANAGDTLSWSSTFGPFAISFLEKSPLNAVTLSSEQVSPGNYSIGPQTIRASAHGHYKYGVAVATTVGTTTTVSIDLGCADVVVSNDGD